MKNKEKIDIKYEVDNRGKTHGLSKHPIYKAWTSIKRRLINNPKDRNYRFYYGAGVRICKEWETDFRAFYDWCIANGWEEGLQIDKDKLSPTKPGKLYSPEFCCFLTHLENCSHTSQNIKYPFNGQMLTLGQISRIIGVKSITLWHRINAYNMTLEEAFTPGEIKQRFGKKSNWTDNQIIEIYKSTLPIKEIVLKFNISRSTVTRIKNREYPYEKILNAI